MRAALLATLLLAACSSDSDPGPGGVTHGEARQLDAAAAMLDQRPGAPLVDATVPADMDGGQVTLPKLPGKAKP
jgi:hypothetical protein